MMRREPHRDMGHIAISRANTRLAISLTICTWNGKPANAPGERGKRGQIYFSAAKQKFGQAFIWPRWLLVGYLPPHRHEHVLSNLLSQALPRRVRQNCTMVSPCWRMSVRNTSAGSVPSCSCCSAICFMFPHLVCVGHQLFAKTCAAILTGCFLGQKLPQKNFRHSERVHAEGCWEEPVEQQAEMP
jgi:hypothetical protein